MGLTPFPRRRLLSALMVTLFLKEVLSSGEGAGRDEGSFRVRLIFLTAILEATGP